MTRKDFTGIAAILLANRPSYGTDSPAACARWNRTVEAFVILCKRDNPNFNRGLFWRACNYPCQNELPTSDLEESAQTDR